MNVQRAGVAGAILALTLLGWLLFPGHTFLHSDTQIYLPILERLRDPSLYPSDPVALRPHVSYTIYDEMARIGRWATGLEFEWILFAQQIAWRACGLFGAFLIGRAARLSVLLSLLIASLYGLGATIGGPAVLILEYEPVPRGYAGPLIVLAIGLAAHARWVAAGIACGVAILYHPPTTFPFCVVFGLLAVSPWRREERAMRLRGLAPVAVASLLVFLLSRMQAGATEPQEFFGRIDADLEKLQRLRGSYNWISMWAAQWIRNYEFLGLICLAAWLRLRRRLSPPLAWFMIAMPLFGLLTIPVSYLLLEGAKWSFMTQFQPARAVLFISLFAMLGSALAGITAAQAGRLPEALAWLMVAFTVPAQADVLPLLLPDLRDAAIRARFFTVAALASVATGAAWWEKGRPLRAAAACALAMLLPFWALPGPAGVTNYPDLDEAELHQLGGWARANTAKDAVFLFPQHGRDLQPGFFRVYGLRGLYVDWKVGGQANLLKEFAVEWWDRWQQAMASPFDPAGLRRYRELGIDYLVLKPGTRLNSRQPVFENARYVVYSLD
jgi:hypothetical protein